MLIFFRCTPGSQILYDEDGSVKVCHQLEILAYLKRVNKENFQRYWNYCQTNEYLLKAAEDLFPKKKLCKSSIWDKEADPQLYGIGLKEVW